VIFIDGRLNEDAIMHGPAAEIPSGLLKVMLDRTVPASTRDSWRRLHVGSREKAIEIAEAFGNLDENIIREIMSS
jgi:hypothetical protein